MFKKAVVSMVAALLVLSSVAPGFAQTNRISMIWHYPSEAPLTSTKYLDLTSPNWFQVNPDLSITDLGTSSYVNSAHAMGMKVEPRLAGINTSGWASFLSDPAKRQTLLENLNEVIARYRSGGAPLDGINLDFEAMGPDPSKGYNQDIKSDFTQFVKEISAAVKGQGMQFSMDVPGLTNYTPTNSLWTGGFDLAALGQIPQVDYLVVMAYDWDYGAAKGYVQDTLAYAVQRVPKNKILLGVPLFSRDFTLDPSSGQRTFNRSYYYQDAVNLFSRPGANPQAVWDSALGLTRITYNGLDGKTHALYLEDSFSLRVKLGLLEQYDVAGMAAWRYKNVDINIWQAIGELTGKVSPLADTTGLLNFSSNGELLAPTMWWKSSPFGFPWNNVKAASGDFNGDGKTDLAALYNYGNGTSGLWAFLSDGSSYSSNLFWKSGPGGFDWNHSKLSQGDFNGDGKDDLAVAYDYGSGSTGLWLFVSDGTSFRSALGWKSKPGNFAWKDASFVSGDINADGKTDIIALYQYGLSTSGIWAFVSDGARLQPKLTWKSLPGNFGWGASKITATDSNGDGKADLAVLYNYGNNTTGLWNFTSNGSTMTPSLAWKSQPGNFSWGASKISGGDVDGDGKGDVSILYNYGGSTTGLWTLMSNGSSSTPKLVWKSVPAGFDWNKALFLTGDADGDGKSDNQVIYDYRK